MIMNNNALKELLKAEPRALKALHYAFHFDYNKPFQVLKIEGNTTINKILKQIEPSSGPIVILSHGADFDNKRYRVATISRDGGFETNVSVYAQYLSTYYRKSDFKDRLKNREDNVFHIIIAQDAENLSKGNCERKTSWDYRPIDYTKRFFIRSKDAIQKKRSWKDSDTLFIFSIILMESESNGNYFKYMPDDESDNLSDIIDKSGYLVEKKRRELKVGAYNLRKQKEKEAFQATDNTAKMNELKSLIDSTRVLLFARLNEVQTADQLESIGEKIFSYNGLKGAWNKYEDMMDMVQRKSYSSIESFENDYNYLKKKILNLTTSAAER